MMRVGFDFYSPTVKVHHNKTMVIFNTRDTFAPAELLLAASIWMNENSGYTLLGIAINYHEDGTELLLTVE